MVQGRTTPKEDNSVVESIILVIFPFIRVGVRSPPQPLRIMSVTQFPDQSNRYSTSGERGGGLGMESADISEIVVIATQDDFAVNTGMMDQ